MKIVRINKYLIIDIVVFSMLAQSCMVYRKTSISYSKAMEAETMKLKKIKTHDGKSHVYRQLDMKDGILYGSYTVAGKLEVLPFTENDIYKIYLLDKSGTIALNTAVMGVGLLTIIVIHELNHMFDGMDFSM